MSTNTPPPNTNGTDNNTPTANSSLPRTPKSGNKNRTCRNVIIHGYCKYEHSGCEFNHDLSTVSKKKKKRKEIFINYIYLLKINRC